MTTPKIYDSCLKRKTFIRFLKNNNFSHILIPPDGNCFFHSVYIYWVLKYNTNCITSNEKLDIDDETNTANLIKNRKKLLVEIPDTNSFSYIKTKTKQELIRKELAEFLKKEDIHNFIVERGGYNGNEKGLQHEIDKVLINGIYNVPIFDLFPIIIATMYNFKVVIHPVLFTRSSCSMGIPQEYHSIYETTTDGCVLNLLYLNGNHYDLLVPKINRTDQENLSRLNINAVRRSPRIRTFDKMSKGLEPIDEETESGIDDDDSDDDEPEEEDIYNEYRQEPTKEEMEELEMELEKMEMEERELEERDLEKIQMEENQLTLETQDLQIEEYEYEPELREVVVPYDYLFCE